MGQFQPGTSGNPGGRPKKDSVVVEAAKAHTEDAIRVLAEVMGGAAPPAARVAAATALLDRAWGKPKQTIEGGGEEGQFEMVQKILLAPLGGNGTG